MSVSNNKSASTAGQQDDGTHSGRFWFYRKEGIIKGPFPAAMLQRFVILGRLTLDTEVSQTRKRWFTVRQVPDLVPEEVARLEATGDASDLEQARIRNDERLRDRRKRLDARADERRKNMGRRGPESEEMIEHREHVKRMLARKRPKTSWFFTAITLLGIIGLIGWGAIYIIEATPKQKSLVQTCHSKPMPGVNWNNCKMEGVQARSKDLNNANLDNADVRLADFHGSNFSNATLAYTNLTKADLSYVDFSRARLVGSRLDGADLSNARLDFADLSYASLLGANLGGVSLKNTKLHKTIWVDGRVCGPNSIGTCR